MLRFCPLRRTPIIARSSMLIGATLGGNLCLRQHNNKTTNFSWFQDFHFVNTTCGQVITAARACGTSSSVTFAKRFNDAGRRLAYVGSLGKFFVTDEDVKTFANGQIGGFGLAAANPAASKKWEAVTDPASNKVLLVSGSAGSGKTILSLQLSKKPHPSNPSTEEPIVFYIIGKDDKFPKLGWSAKFASTEERNAAAKEAVENLLLKMVGEVAPDEASALPSIVVVIENVGLYTPLVCALSAEISTFGPSLYEKLTKKKGGKVHFILAGRGAECATFEGMNPGSYEHVRVDELATGQAMFANLFK